MGILLDTCVWVDLEMQAVEPEVLQGLAGPQITYASAIVLAELHLGEKTFAGDPERARRRRLIADVSQLPLLAIDGTTAAEFASLAARIILAGGNPRRRVHDLWLAAQCIQHDVALVTRNRDDFAELPGLRLLTYSR